MAKLRSAALLQQLEDTAEAERVQQIEYFTGQMQGLSDRIEALQEARDARCTNINKTRDAIVSVVNEAFAGFRSNSVAMYDEIISDTQSMIDSMRKQLDLITEDEPAVRLTPESLRVVDDAA